MIEQEVKRPGQRERGRLVAGDEERHRLVANLSVVQEAAVGVAAEDERRQKVVGRGLGAAAAAVGDELTDHRVEAVKRAAEAAIGRRRQPRRQRQEAAQDTVDVTLHGLERVARGGGLFRQIDREQRAADDGQRQPHALVGQVDGPDAAGGQHPRRRALRLGGHDADVMRDRPRRKGGRDQAAVAAMARVVDRQQAVAEQRPREAAQGRPLFEGVGLRDEHLVGQLRRRDDDQPPRAEVERAQVAALGAQPREQRQPIAPKLQQVADQRRARQADDGHLAPS